MATAERSTANMADIAAFFAEKRIAIVGVSRDPKDFSRYVLQAIVAKGYDVVPVNPLIGEVEGRVCFPTVSAIVPRVRAVLVMTPPTATEQVVRECAECGAEVIWMHRSAGPGAVNGDAVRYCKERGIPVIAGECPMMFLPGTDFPHRVHGFVRKVFGKYPR